VNGAEVAVTCSLGVSTIADAATTIEGLIESVRLELAESKSGGKNRVCSSGEAATATTPLGDVLNGHGLRAFHQPIYDLLEDRIVAFELLVRGPQGRYESPEVFLDLLRPGEGLTHLDIACLQTCVEAARKLPPDVCLHFNLFPSTLVSLGAERVASELRQAGPERRFCVELNERGTSGGSKELLDEVRALKAEGIQVAIDDVGFGASSLEALVHMEPDVIKLDRTCASGEIDARALERLLGVASVLRARVITEGIEDAEGLERLTALHVRYGQGYLWGRPEPVEADDPGVLWPRSRRVTPAPARDEREGREAAREAACRRTSA
jgi:EAL domain-containing protein (putative c-di-GMP-specific phosphodiesterase class I)